MMEIFNAISYFFEKYFLLDSSPKILQYLVCLGGGMVDTKDLKSFGHCGRAGSIPASGTKASQDWEAFFVFPVFPNFQSLDHAQKLGSCSKVVEYRKNGELCRN